MRHHDFSIGRLRKPDGPDGALADAAHANIGAFAQARDIIEIAADQIVRSELRLLAADQKHADCQNRQRGQQEQP